MRKVFYNSILAKILLCLSSCETITLGLFVFTTRASLSQTTLRHELTHSLQYCEWFIASSILVLLSGCFFVYPWWMALLPIVAYYIVYILEWIVRLVYCLPANSWNVAKASKAAYRLNSFEAEAYMSEMIADYNVSRDLFNNYKYL